MFSSVCDMLLAFHDDSYPIHIQERRDPSHGQFTETAGTTSAELKDVYQSIDETRFDGWEVVLYPPEQLSTGVRFSWSVIRP